MQRLVYNTQGELSSHTLMDAFSRQFVPIKDPRPKHSDYQPGTYPPCCNALKNNLTTHITVNDPYNKEVCACKGVSNAFWKRTG